MSNFNAKELIVGDLLELNTKIISNNFINYGKKEGKLLVEVISANNYLFTVKNIKMGEEYSFLTSSFDTTKNIWNRVLDNVKIRVEINKIESVTFFTKIRKFINKFV